MIEPDEDMKSKMKLCDCCEKSYGVDKLIKDGGLLLCSKCKKYCDENYSILMAEEANEGKDK
jgi:hypothetical protein